jgi:hypothetical protein
MVPKRTGKLGLLAIDILRFMLGALIDLARPPALLPFPCTEENTK